MCGIVGAVANRPVAALLIDGLKKLEYRGYDSAGIALLDKHHALKRIRVLGKVRELERTLSADFMQPHIGIAHTRWATHGVPAERNAHPLASHDQFALVHNGIIENYHEIRERLQQLGYEFSSDTDTETAVHLIHYYFKQENDLLTAVKKAVGELKGAYAFAIISTEFPDRLIGVRRGSPLVVGHGKGENFLASDPLALLAVTKQFIYLEDNDIVDITKHHIHIYNQDEKVEREIHTLSMHANAVERGIYKHYMQKEIMEQPLALKACLANRIVDNHIAPNIFGKDSQLLSRVEHVHLVACGTSHHAAMIARYWIESLAHIPCTVEVASEFRYRDIALPKNSLFVALSQSGETADTLAALRLAKKMDYISTLVICNAPGSTMVREADMDFFTHAGMEIGVASTKAFVTQLVALLLLALVLQSKSQLELDKNKTKNLMSELIELVSLPEIIQTVLTQDAVLADWAKLFINKQHALFIGRGALYPVALEGALKMKEISYIHAEGYPSGELKHGPLALVDDNMPIVATVPADHLFEKSLSNLQEVKARGGKLFVLTDQPALFQQAEFANAHVITMPVVSSLLMPIVYTIPLQLLAYHVAVLKGTDVDQPRNLAKSVTVE
jgi:glucosamine--fructose-6-phosphate aminotransferase (isomerizing)